MVVVKPVIVSSDRTPVLSAFVIGNVVDFYSAYNSLSVYKQICVAKLSKNVSK